MNEFLEKISEISLGSLKLSALISVLILLIVCIIAIKIISTIVGRLIDKSRLESSVKGFLQKSVKVLLWTIAVIILAGRLGIETTSLVAVLSVAGLALSLSIQDTIANLFSGMTILATRPFATGDYVELGEVGGTITQVGLFYTTVTTPDNKSIYVPNGQVTAAKIINYTRQDKRRVDFAFRASYEDATELVFDALKEAVFEEGRILSEPAEPFMGIMAYKESSIEYVLRVWVHREDYWQVYFGLNKSVREIFQKHGIKMPFDQLSVHIVPKD
ncbi:MAG: mechanosensitive ion channel family protein [Clostridiales bacterium]|nr:mechanosensitive ion channel family protein [Clostridiales bacterium]